LTVACDIVFNIENSATTSLGGDSMAERPIEELTLREMFTNSESLVRDFIEHLNKSFHPKARALGELVRSYNIPAERDAIPDGSVRAHVSTLLASDDYSQAFFQKLDQYLQAIEERSQVAISGK
jgi:hypothetical protein